MNMLTSSGPPAPQPQRAAPIGVMDVIRTYRRRMPLFLAVALAIFGAAAAYTWLQPRRYTGEASVVVVPRRAEVGSDRSSPLGDPAADANVDTQVEAIASPTLAAQVVDRLRLDRQPAFDRLTRTPSLMERAGLAAPDQPIPAAGRRQAAIDRLAQDISVRRVAQTFVLDIRYTAGDPKLAAAVANAFADGYVRQSLDLKLGGANAAGKLLGERLQVAQADAQAAQSAVGRYKVAHNLISASGGTLAEQQLTSFQQQAAEARVAQAEADARLNTARSQLARGSNGEDVGEALGSPVVQELRRQRAEASRKLAELSSRYGDRHPSVQAARGQLADYDTQIHAEVGRVISNLEAQSGVAGRRAGAVGASLAGAQSALAGNNVASVRLADLQSRAETARTLFEELLVRVREISTQSATMQPDARVASVAVPPPRSSSPNVPINLIVGALLAIAGGIAAVLLRHGLDQGIGTLEDVENRLHLPYLASLPTLHSSLGRPGGKDPVRALLAHRSSSLAEGHRALAASVLQGVGQAPVRIIAITSALPNEGKTTTAIGLARMLAMSGRRTVLVDGDLRRPRIARALRIQPDHGLHAVLAGETTIDEAIVHDETGLAVLASSDIEHYESPPAEDGRMDRLLGQLRDRYDVVVIDVGPVLPVVYGRLIARNADAVVLLARWRSTPESAVELAAHLLAQVGVAITGVALTQVDLRQQSRTGYGDPAKFLKSYETYYA